MSTFAMLKGSQRWTYWLCLLCISALMTVKYFPGLENELAYAGNAFQTIHPDSFFGDTSLDPAQSITTKPLRLSLLYIFPKIFGELWLDDFYLAFFYSGMVAVSLLGVDRVAVYIGLSRPLDRLILLLFFAKDHQILTGKVLVAHHQDVNHSALAIPVTIWLLYFAISKRTLVLLVGISIVLVAVSTRVALFPVLFAMGMKFTDGTKNERLCIAVLSLAGLVAMYFFLFKVYPIAETDRLQMWDILKNVEGDDANAFQADTLGPLWVRHGIWLAIVICTFFVAGRHKNTSRSIKTLMAMGIVIWLIHGLYINFSPDYLKMPLLLSLVPARSLSVVQNFAYIVLIAALLSKVHSSTTFSSFALCLVLLAILYAAGPGSRLIWFVLVVLAMLACAAALWYLQFRGIIKTASLSQHGLALVLFPLLFASSLNYAVAFHKNWGAWQSAWHHGVYGHSSSAKWVGVAEYLRTDTPPSTSVLAFECVDKDTPCPRLEANRSLATRSGRAISVPDVVGPGFTHPDTWVRLDSTRKELDMIGTDLLNGDVNSLASSIESFTPPPDYLILPKQLGLVELIENKLPFVRVHNFPEFVAFKKVESQ